MVLSLDHYISLKNASETFIHSGDTFGVPQIEAVMQAVFGDYATVCNAQHLRGHGMGKALE